jgi:curli biogenesis system outer membrane secretion channel CsgG
MITRRYGAVLWCCLLFLLGSCPSVPHSRTGADPSAADPPAQVKDLREALALCGRTISENMDTGANVAVISVAAPDLFEGEYVLEELTLLLVRSQKFRVVDRRNLDIIRAEQQFQLSGEVDDETAVSIGHLIGAAFVITGSISPWESARYLRFKVLDVQTGQIKIMTSVAYGGEI